MIYLVLCVFVGTIKILMGIVETDPALPSIMHFSVCIQGELKFQYKWNSNHLGQEIDLLWKEYTEERSMNTDQVKKNWLQLKERKQTAFNLMKCLLIYLIHRQKRCAQQSPFCVKAIFGLTPRRFWNRLLFYGKMFPFATLTLNFLDYFQNREDLKL